MPGTAGDGIAEFACQSYAIADKIPAMATIVEPDVLERLLEPLSVCLTPAVARRVVKLRADSATQIRIADLAKKSTSGLLSPDEEEEYRTYVSAGTFIAILQSKARTLLASKSRT
jgi:hypothetical protein